MAVVELIYDVKPYSYITSNPTKILSNGEPIYLSDGRYGFGDGITTLSSLPLYGGSGYAFTGLTSQYTRGDGTYATFPTNISSFTNDSGYITSSALSPYLTIANAALTYQPIGSYLTGLTVGSTAIGSGTNTRILYNNAGVLGEYTVTGTGTTAVLSTSPTFTTDITTPLIIGGTGANQVLTFQNTTGATTSAGGAYLFKAGNLGADLITINQRNFIFSPINATAGAITSFTFTTPANTSQTASTEISNFKVNGASKTWAAGAITTQRWNYFTANTAAFASASTITNSYGLYVEAATAGTNATITNNWAAGFIGNVTVFDGYFLNARIKPRITTITSSATPTINTDNCDAVTITALATAITSMTTNLSGTPNNFDKLTFRIKDNGTARAITWGASFEPKGVALPTTTVISKVLTVGFIYDSVTSKWGCVSSAQEI